MKTVSVLSAVVVLSSVAGSALAQAGFAGANGYFMGYRNFNDYGNSTISVNGGGTPSGVSGLNVTIRDTVTANDTGNFANRHFAWFSRDGGATPYGLQAGENIVVTGKMRITNSTFNLGGVQRSPTLEGGPFFFPSGSPTDGGNDGGMWVINNRTVFTGGMGSDFALLGEGNGSNVAFPPLYTPGGVAEFGYSLFADNPATPANEAGYEAFLTDMTSGLTVSTGRRGFDPNGPTANGLPAGSLIGLRMQFAPIQGLDQFGQIEYFDVSVSNSYIPSPAAASLLGLGMLAGMRRRR
jgi:uncharacterized protein (TIGR03382 family)